MNDLEELKKQFIVDKDNYEKEKLPQYLKTILNFGNIDKLGRVHISKASLTLIEKITLSFVARFLGNQLDENISKDVTAEELSLVAGSDSKVISARLAELVNANVVNRVDRGKYTIKPYYVDTFLRELELKYGESKDNIKTDLSSKIRGG